MRKTGRTRVVIGVVTALVAVLGVVGGLFYHPATAAAASLESYNTRTITVNPDPQAIGKPDPNTAVFSCQTDRGPDQLVCYSPQQIRKAYGTDKLIARGITGKGRTIVIVDAFQNPEVVDDLQAFDSAFGLPDPVFQQYAPYGLTPFDINDDSQVSWAGEIDLDVQWAHAIAPAARIDLVLAKTNDDLDILKATEYAIDHNLGDVISQSFGENEACVDPKLLAREHKAFEKATQKGITLFASAGDEGSAEPTCDGASWVKAASSPASDPLVTAVGGTELTAAFDYAPGVTPPAGAPAPGTYESEEVWNNPPGFLSDGSISGGGGFSTIYTRPAYQVGVANTQRGSRGVPDVAYNAGVNHGVIVAFGIGGGFFLFGGTSAGSPQWAALVALADQLGGRRLGFINTALYRLSRVKSLYKAEFHDVTVGNNAVQEFDEDGNLISVPGFTSKTGWDAASGLGSPRADTLLPSLVIYNYLTDGTSAIRDAQHHNKNQ